MTFWIWVLLIIAIVFISICLSQISFHFHGTRVKNDDNINLVIKGFYGFFRYRYNIPYVQYEGIWNGIVVKLQSKSENVTAVTKVQQKEKLTPRRIERFFKKFKRIVEHIVDLNEWLRRTIAHIKCTQFRWYTTVGVGDAPETAILTGLIWGVKSTLCGFAFRLINLQTQPKLAVHPRYNSTQFSTEISCIGKIRLGYAILAGLLLGVRMMKVKGGVSTWQNILFKAS